MIDGKKYRDLSLLGFLQQLPRQIDFIGLDERLTNLLSLGFEERISHAAANDQGVDLAHQIPNHANLVADFCPAENCDKRRLRMFQRLPQILKLFFHQQTGRRF